MFAQKSANRRARVIATSALGALMLATPGSLRAQVAATPPAPAPDSGIQEITVTAQKRSQSVQDVGITMSVLSQDALVNAHVTTVSDIANLVPSVQANYGAGQVAFNVRGIGTNEFSANLDSPVAVNLDEVYIAKTFETGLLLFDVDRVEVLKGPQGTLYGRNATGGAINFFSRKPTDTLSAGETVSYDNYETVRNEAYISGPIGGGFSARLSGVFVNQGKGFYEDVTLGRREDQEKKWAIRGQLKYTDGPTTALLTVNGGEQNGTLAPYQGVGVFTPASVAAGNPVFCAPYLAGTASGGDAGCVRGTDGKYPGTNDPYIATNNRLHIVHNRDKGASLRIEHDFGNSTLTSISSYQDFTRDQHEDSDGSPTDTIDADYYNREKEATQEVRLSSNKAKVWNYVVGLYFEHDDYRNGDYLNFDYGATPGLYSPFTQKTNAFAAFFNNDVSVTDSLILTAGIRYSRETNAFKGGTDLATGRTGSPSGPTAIGAQLAYADESRTDDAATYKVGIEWKPVINSPFVDKFMIYANSSTGFRSGSYNADYVSSTAELTSLSPENITAYEAGVKTVLDDRKITFDAAIFHYQFTNGFINVDSPTSPVPITINAAGISTYGAEFEVNWRPIEQFTIAMGGSWLNAKIDSNISSGGITLKDKTPIQSPTWTYNVQGTFDQPITDDLLLNLSLDANYRSAQFFESTDAPASRVPGYWVANGHASISRTGSRWSLGAFVKNLTQSTYRVYVNDLPGLGFVLNGYDDPRTFGLEASVKF